MVSLPSGKLIHWQEIIRRTLIPGRLDLYFELDEHDLILSETIKEYFAATIECSGWFFPWLKMDSLIKNLIARNASKILFFIESAVHLRPFAAEIKVSYPPDTMPAIQVLLPIFSPGKFMGLRYWEDTGECAHGSRQGADHHFKFWMEEVERLPPNAVIHLWMLEPWRDYYRLRILSEPLRSPRLRVHIRLLPTRWNQVPNAELHLKLTVAAITGLDDPRLLSHIDQDEAEWLTRFGCTGLLDQGRVMAANESCDEWW